MTAIHTRVHARYTRVRVNRETLLHPALECGKAPATRTEKPILLARQVSRLCPDRRGPERFHVEKSEIAATLRRLARAPLRQRHARAALDHATAPGVIGCPC